MIIWLASYPRSGNTFFRLLLWHYYGMETYSVYDDKPLQERQVIWEIVGHKPRSMSVEEMTVADETFFVKTHDFPSDGLPAIYLVRDGRDALVSYAHYILSFENQGGAGNLETVFQDTLHDLIAYTASFGGWGANVMAWAQRPAPTAIIKFETLVTSSDPLAIIREAMGKIDCPLEPVKTGSTHPTFDELHRQMPKFFRKGRIGDWKNVMPLELQTLFLERYGEALKLMGYYDESQDNN